MMDTLSEPETINNAPILTPIIDLIAVKRDRSFTADADISHDTYSYKVPFYKLNTLEKKWICVKMAFENLNNGAINWFLY